MSRSIRTGIENYPKTFVVLFCLVVSLTTRAVILPLSVIGVDEGIYFLVAEKLFEGSMPFSVYFDHKPMLLYYLQGIWSALTDNMVFWIRVQQIFVAGFSGAMVSLFVLKRTSHPVGVAAGFGAAYVLMSGSFGGFTANPEGFVNLFALVALFVASKPVGDEPGRTRKLIVDSIILGMLYALMFQTNYLAALPVLGIHVVFLVARFSTGVGQNLARVGWSVAFTGGSFLALSMLILLPQILYGDVWAYFSDQVMFVRGYQKPAELTFILESLVEAAGGYIAFVVPTIFVVAGAIRRKMTPRDDLDDRTKDSGNLQFTGLTYVTFSLLSCFASGRVYVHYFPIVLPGLALTAIAFFHSVKPTDRRRYLGWILLFSMICFIAYGRPFLSRGAAAVGAWASGQPVDLYARVSTDIRNELAELPGSLDDGQTALYVYHHISIFYQMVGVLAPTRYPFTFHHLEKQYTDRFGIEPVEEMARIMATRPMFIVAGSVPSDGYFGPPSAVLAKHVTACYGPPRFYDSRYVVPAYVYKRLPNCAP